MHPFQWWFLNDCSFESVNRYKPFSFCFIKYGHRSLWYTRWHRCVVSHRMMGFWLIPSLAWWCFHLSLWVLVVLVLRWWSVNHLSVSDQRYLLVQRHKMGCRFLLRRQLFHTSLFCLRNHRFCYPVSSDDYQVDFFFFHEMSCSVINNEGIGDTFMVQLPGSE